MDLSILWRSALVQLGAVAALSGALALALPKSFFEDWGWLSGPAAWVACAALTATALKLPRGPVLLGAVVAGIPSVVAVIAGVHWAGVVIAVACFALWCARLAGRGEGRVAWT
jgi:hypothetical protein